MCFWVKVTATTENRMGGAHWEAARFVTRAVRRAPRGASPESSALRDRIDSLTLEAQKLRRSLADGQARTKELAAKMNAMTTREP